MQSMLDVHARRPGNVQVMTHWLLAPLRLRGQPVVPVCVMQQTAPASPQSACVMQSKLEPAQMFADEQVVLAVVTQQSPRAPQEPLVTPHATPPSNGQVDAASDAPASPMVGPSVFASGPPPPSEAPSEPVSTDPSLPPKVSVEQWIARHAQIINDPTRRMPQF